jgi:hypothetical protein
MSPDDKLGINVLPIDVRLILGPEDPYKWSRLLAYEYLFQKHLSKHSIEAYMTIYYRISKYFEAVPTDHEAGLLCSLMGYQETYSLPISQSKDFQQVRH